MPRLTKLSRKVDIHCQLQTDLQINKYLLRKIFDEAVISSFNNITIFL